MLALAAAGYDVREVPATRTAERRRRRRRAKTDIEDAEAIARETLSDPGLPPAGKHAAPSPAWEELVVIRDWRESLVLQRMRLLNEAEPVLVSLPVSVREQLPATSRVRAALARLAAIQAAICAIDSQLKDLDRQLAALLADLGCTLTAIHGIGVVTAMTLITEIGDAHRFATESQFARWCGAAPVALSSGEGDGPARRHRLDLGGNRVVNSVLHIVHITQARCHPPPRAYLAQRAPGKTKRELRRAHERQLANVIIRHTWKDADRHAHSTPGPVTAAA
jgi:transposase